MPAAAHLESPPPLQEPLDLDDGVLLRVPPEAHTLAGFRSWVLSDDVPEKLNIAYYQGEILLDMTMEGILTHAAVKTESARVLTNLNEDIDFGDLYINGVLVTNIEAEVSNNPDLVAVFWESLEAGRVRYVRRRHKELEIEGSPDWILEIVSDSSVKKDTRLLRAAYHKAKVREYWLVDARGDDVLFTILHWRKSGYVAAEDQDGWKKSRVFSRHFRLTRRKDRRGGWKYRLEARVP